ncbi:CHAT domain-containing protein [Fortiea contorta]|uniref:CHAT domain-containing protein n=1 Tax=Fortiea contorta TaxID=1892405 RepID=UPI000347B7E3|nr:CHAT domain-containing protein [Fortiea contorta]
MKNLPPISPGSRSLPGGNSPEEMLRKKKLQELEDISKIETTNSNKTKDDITFTAQLTNKDDPTVVHLYVIEEDNKYRIRFYNALLPKEGFQEIKELKPPRKFFSRLKDEYIHYTDKDINAEILELHRQVSADVKIFSHRRQAAKKIHEWLQILEKKLHLNQEKLSYIVINDRTSFEIPWEILELPNNQYLGASFVTVRWQDISSKYTEDKDIEAVNEEYTNEGNLLPVKRPIFKHESCSGQIVGCINKEFRTANLEESVIKKYGNSYKECQNINDFIEVLNDASAEICLAFISCHGYYEDNIYEMKLVARDDQEEAYEISLNLIYRYKFSSFKKPSIIFMNACHSGRLGKDEWQDSPEYFLTGFATFFLEKGASGVIGTLGAVLDEYAAKFTENFFEKCREYPKLPAAEILKKMREDAVKNYKPTDPESEFIFLITFMYVYYGNPLTVLQLPQI